MLSVVLNRVRREILIPLLTSISSLWGIKAYAEFFPHAVGSTTAISKEDLLAVTNDKSGTPNRTIVYMVTSPPRLGKLVALLQADNSTEDISSFTQAMVRVEHTHTHTHS